MIDCGLHPTWHFCRVQPLNLAFEEPLKDSFNRARECYLRRSTREEMTPCDPAYFSTKSVYRLVKLGGKKWISGIRAADVCLLNLEIFSETEYELNEKINKLTNMESEGDSPSVTSQVSTQSAVYFANHSLGGSSRILRVPDLPLPRRHAGQTASNVRTQHLETATGAPLLQSGPLYCSAVTEGFAKYCTSLLLLSCSNFLDIWM